MMRSARLYWVGVIVVWTGGVAGCSSARGTGVERQLAEPPYRVDRDNPNRLRVREDLIARMTTASPTDSSVRAKVTGYGRLGFASDAAYSVRVPFPSYVERVRVRPGDRVVAGQVLADLRSSDLARLRAELASGQVQVRVERDALERLRPLVADGTATQRELAEAEGRLQVAEAEYASVRQALVAVGSSAGVGDRYALRATTSGSVVRRNLAPGERVNPEDEPAFLIGDPDQLVVRASFPDRDGRWLEEGAPCSFTVHALGNRRFQGSLTRLLRAVNPTTRSVEAFCAPTEQAHDLSAEMTARVEVEVHGEGGLLVPRSALLMKRDQWVAFVRTDRDILERRNVQPGVTLGDAVQVLEGVASGEDVVIEGAVLLDGELDVLL